MRKLIIAALACLFTAHAYAVGIPAHITYQGTLRDKGVPANGSYTLSFRITDGSGLTQYWASGPQTVSINQGLFTVLLSPTGVDWQNVTPYIEVSVGSPGQALGPLEPINATVYASMSASVIDGAITREKIEPTSFEAPGAGLVPQGAILMFDTNCPSGWTRFTNLDGLFPQGSSSYGQTGGSSTHAHLLPIFQQGSGPGFGIARPQDSPWGGQAYPGTMLTNTFASGGTLNNLEASLSSTASNVPPYMTMIFCKKN